MVATEGPDTAYTSFNVRVRAVQRATIYYQPYENNRVVLEGTCEGAAREVDGACTNGPMDASTGCFAPRIPNHTLEVTARIESGDREAVGIAVRQQGQMGDRTSLSASGGLVCVYAWAKTDSDQNNDSVKVEATAVLTRNSDQQEVDRFVTTFTVEQRDTTPDAVSPGVTGSTAGQEEASTHLTEAPEPEILAPIIEPLEAIEPVEEVETVEDSEPVEEARRDTTLVGVAVRETGDFLKISDGETAPYTVVLEGPPTHAVTVAVEKDFGPPQLLASPAALVFTADDWAQPRQVVVSSPQDGDSMSGNGLFFHTVGSDDATYDGIGSDDVRVRATDYDNFGGGGSFRAWLARLPA